jgi:hypothetical protein
MSQFAPPGGMNFTPIANALIPSENPKAVPILLPFASGTLSFEVDLTETVQQKRISVIQGIYIDARSNTGVFEIEVQTTRQVIAVPAGTQGYIPLLAGSNPKFTMRNSAAVNVQVTFLNVPVPALLWNGSASGGGSTVNQGAAGAEPWPVQIYNATGALDASNPLTVSGVEIGAADGGTAATFSALAGGIHNAAPPTLADGDQAALQLDDAGNLKVVATNGGVNSADFSVTIASGQSLSTIINNPSLYSPVNIYPPAAWTAANLLVLGSLDGTNFAPLRDVTGTVFSFPFNSTHALNIAPALVFGWPYLRFQSVDIADATVAMNQSGDRTLAGKMREIA